MPSAAGLPRREAASVQRLEPASVLRLEAAGADQAHAIADVGGNRLAQTLGIASLETSDGDPMLIDEIRGAKPAVNDSHERPELQPQGLDQLQQGLPRLG